MSTSVAFTIVDLTVGQAAEIYKQDWWIGQDLEQAAHRQLFTNGFIMPFDAYYDGLKKLLKRDINPTEALAFEPLREEYLGLKTKPSYEESQEVVRTIQGVATVQDERES